MTEKDKREFYRLCSRLYSRVVNLPRTNLDCDKADIEYKMKAMDEALAILDKIEKGMDYSNKGILVMLQDLQRIHFGRFSFYVNVTLSDEGESPLVSCTVFDEADEPHCFSFYSYETDEGNRVEYQKVLELIKTTTGDGQKCKA